MSGRMDGKVAVVTGAASGIGLAIVERFVAEGGLVLAADIQDGKGEALATRFKGKVVYRRCDVTDVSQIKAAVDEAVAAFGGLDVMVNNAGAGGSVAMVEDAEVGAYEWTMQLLLRSVVFGTKYAIPLMRNCGGGAVLNTASAAAYVVGGTPFAYSVCKAAVVQFTRAAAIETAPHKIRVNALCPGVIATPIWGQFRPDSTPEAADQMTAMMAHVGAGMQPLPKAGLPDDIADAALYLCSDEAAFVTGHALVVDGGILLGRQARTSMGMAVALGADPEEASKGYQTALAAERARFGG
jgi:NAD(P)-dependent dehydrogenase (short-subunit alcohol dehydrogenase family)